MLAWTLPAPGPVEKRPLELVELPAPVPRHGEVRVRMSACGICRTDLHVVEGELAVRKARVVPGHQIVGVVEALGPGVSEPRLGERVGIAWLHETCGACRFCLLARENLCDAPQFTGWTVDGGFAEQAVAPADFTYRLPDDMADLEAAPLLCAGIIGFRALSRTRLDERGWRGARLGIYGFGAAGHVAIQLARARGAEVFVCTRDRTRHQALARELGAAWVGDTFEAPPAPLDAAIVFAPAGEIVPAALARLDKGGALVLGGIHMSDVPSFPYAAIYGEREIRSVANNTRADGRAFLREATETRVRTHVVSHAFEELPEALIALKHDAVRGAAVLMGKAAPRPTGNRAAPG